MPSLSSIISNHRIFFQVDEETEYMRQAFLIIVLIVGAKLPGVTYEATGGERVTTAVKTAELYSVMMTSFFMKAHLWNVDNECATMKLYKLPRGGVLCADLR